MSYWLTITCRLYPSICRYTLFACLNNLCWNGFRIRVWNRFATCLPLDSFGVYYIKILNETYNFKFGCNGRKWSPPLLFDRQILWVGAHIKHLDLCGCSCRWRMQCGMLIRIIQYWIYVRSRVNGSCTFYRTIYTICFNVLCDHRNKQRSLLFHDVYIALVDLAGLHVAMPSFSMDGWFVIVRQSYSHSKETKVYLFMQFITICCWCAVNSTQSRLCEPTNNKTKNCAYVIFGKQIACTVQIYFDRTCAKFGS